MSNIFHICWGDSAAGALKQRNSFLGLHEPVIGIVDDFSVGELGDADNLIPSRRLAWHECLETAQWWYDESYGAALFEYWKESQEFLLSAVSTSFPIVVWIGNNAHDKLMLAMLASITSRETSIRVIDVNVQLGFHNSGYSNVSLCAPEILIDLKPVEISNNMRDALSLEWDYWKSHAAGWRILDASGSIVEMPLNHADVMLLTHLSRTYPKPASSIIKEVIEKNPLLGCASYSFKLLFWRLNILRQTGLLVFIPSTEPKPSPPLILLR